MKIILAVVGALLTVYAGFAFVQLEINPLLWNDDARFAFVLFAVGASMFSGLMASVGKAIL